MVDSCKEFKGLSKSTVQGVMAENNCSYTRSRATLLEIAEKSWRFSFSSFFRRSARLTTISSSPPPTGCEELDLELYALGDEGRYEQIATDRALAEKLNEEEHAAAEELVECECCYGDYAWELTAACTEGHFFCHSCLIKSVQEGVYGQGNNIVAERSTIRCLSSSAQPACDAFVSLDLLKAALPEDVLISLEDRTAAESLEMSGLQLVKCSFCGYAEVDEPRSFRVKASARAILIVAAFLASVSLAALSNKSWLLVFLALPVGIMPNLRPELPTYLSSCFSHIKKVVQRIQVRRRGTLFKCDNPRCKKESCTECSKEWAPFHKCFQKEEDGVRVHVEKAMANAVKRTVCPSPWLLRSCGCS